MQIFLILIESLFPFVSFLMISYLDSTRTFQLGSYLINFFVILIKSTSEFNELKYLKKKKKLATCLAQININFNFSSPSNSNEKDHKMLLLDEISFRQNKCDLQFEQILGSCEDIIFQSSEGVIVLTNFDKIIYSNYSAVKFLMPDKDI